MNTFEVICRGCAMRDRDIVWSSHLGSIQCDENNSYLVFEREPTNKVDPNAVKLISKGEIFGELGYIGREYTHLVQEILAKGTPYKVKIKDTREIGSREITLLVEC